VDAKADVTQPGPGRTTPAFGLALPIDDGSSPTTASRATACRPSMLTRAPRTARRATPRRRKVRAL